MNETFFCDFRTLCICVNYFSNCGIALGWSRWQVWKIRSCSNLTVNLSFWELSSCLSNSILVHSSVLSFSRFCSSAVKGFRHFKRVTSFKIFKSPFPSNWKSKFRGNLVKILEFWVHPNCKKNRQCYSILSTNLSLFWRHFFYQNI